MTTLVICNIGKTTHPANNAVDTYLAFSVGPPDSTSGAGSVNKKGRSAILRRIDLTLKPLLSDSLDQIQLAGWTYIMALASRRGLFYLFIFLITKY